MLCRIDSDDGPNLSLCFHVSCRVAQSTLSPVARRSSVPLLDEEMLMKPRTVCLSFGAALAGLWLGIPPVMGHEGHEHPGPVRKPLPKPSPADIENIHKLPASDWNAAIAQGVCPVTDDPLGSMGVPRKLLVKGGTIFVCCKGCESEVLSDPDKFLRKLQSTLPESPPMPMPNSAGRPPALQPPPIPNFAPAPGPIPELRQPSQLAPEPAPPAQLSWVPPVYQTVYRTVWMPEETEFRQIAYVNCCGRVSAEWQAVIVRPGGYSTQRQQLLVRPGHWASRSR